MATKPKTLIHCLILNFIENFPKEVALDMLKRIEKFHRLEDSEKLLIDNFKKECDKNV